MNDIARLAGVFLLFIALACGVRAQIYETTDDHGNPVFSDTPSPDAKKRALPPENIADAHPPIKSTVDTPTGKQQPIPSGSESVSGLSADILADDQLVCGMQLSNFVAGESEAERLYDRPEPTELDSVQRKQLEQLFAAMGRDWRGEKVFYKCMAAGPESEVKILHRKAKSSGSWDKWNSELTFKTEAFLNAKTTGTLFEFYGVDHGLYFFLKSFGSGSGPVAGIPPNLKKPGNRVQIVNLGTNRLGFLIKQRNVEGILKPQLVSVESGSHGLTIKRASFVNAVLTDWVITRLSR